MRTCKTCQTTDPAEFYPTQAASYCRTHFIERYIVPGRERLLQAKLERGQCADCQLKVTLENAVVFDWDHLHGKTRNVSVMNTAPDALFHAETSKCELVCANCHRLRTLKRGWKGGRPRHALLPIPPALGPGSVPGLPGATTAHQDTHP